jgi:hypothetical protein
MADTTIGGLTPAVSVNSTDLLPIFQEGQTLSSTVSQIQAASLGYGFVVTQSTGSLPQSRALTAGNGINIFDLGAGSTVTVQLQANPNLTGTGSLGLPAGTTAERPGGTFGLIRANSTLNALEWYDGLATWSPLASAAVYVSSVALSLPSELTVTGSPITTSGTLGATWASAAQNAVFAGPSGSAGTPSFRALVAGDIPSLPYLSSALADTYIFVGNGSGVATGVALSGDATLANTGAITVDKFNGGTAFGSMAGQDASAVAITGGTATLSDLHCGDVGTEGGGININGVTYQSTLKVSDIDGTNFAQTILHRHSTTLEPLILGARSNINTTGHAAVTNGMNVFTIYGAGSAGTNYKLFGQVSIAADDSGTISNTSAPGKLVFAVTPDASVSPVIAMTIHNSGSIACASGTFTLNGTQVLTANQSITLSGDVSGTGSTAITTAIGANKVTVGMMAQAAGSTILGNSSTSTADVAALTDAQAATVLARYLELAPRWYS